MPHGSPPPDRLALTATEVAALLGVSRAHVWRLNAAGKLPEPIRLGKAVRWQRAELEKWLEAGAPDRSTWQRDTAPLFCRNGARRAGETSHPASHGTESA